MFMVKKSGNKNLPQNQSLFHFLTLQFFILDFKSKNL